MGAEEDFTGELLQAGWVHAGKYDDWRSPHGGSYLMSPTNAVAYERKRRALAQWEEDLRQAPHGGREGAGHALDDPHAQLKLLTEARTTFQEIIQHMNYRVPWSERVKSARLTKWGESPEWPMMASDLTFLLAGIPIHTLSAKKCLPEPLMTSMPFGTDGEKPWRLAKVRLSGMRCLLERLEPLGALFELVGERLQWREDIPPNIRVSIALHVYEQHELRIGF